jgi:hypothetical protein
MTSSTDLKGLLERVKGATGPDRALDLALARALVPDVIVLRQRNDDSGADPFTYWQYTDKIDDALALVERVLPGCWYALAKGRMTEAESLFGCELLFGADEQLGIADGPTQALAILSALLSALIAKETVSHG